MNINNTPLGSMGIVLSLLVIALSIAGCGIHKNITFAGKVTNNNSGEWPNERLVLLFLKGQEIGRSFTERGKFSSSREGVHDGLFVIEVSNTYEIILDDFQLPQGIEVKFIKDPIGSDNNYFWFPEVEEGSLVTMPVPSKNIDYIIKVLAGDRSTLPTAILNPGSTSLDQNNTIVVSLTMSDTGPITGDVQRALVDTNIQAIEYSDEPKTININRITVPLNNCGGSARLTQQYIQSQTFIYEYQSEVGGRTGLNMPLGWVSLILELEARYGYKQGQIDERTINTTLTAEPETNQSYLITWQEIWESGSGIAVVGEDTVSIPFRVRTNVIHSIFSEKLSC